MRLKFFVGIVSTASNVLPDSLCTAIHSGMFPNVTETDLAYCTGNHVCGWTVSVLFLFV